MKNQKTSFVILGLLSIQPLSGYKMKKLIEKSIGHFWSESNGQLYPALQGLVHDKLVTLIDSPHKGKMVSNVYSITEKGKNALKEWLERSTERKSLHRDEELLKLFFGNSASIESSIFLLQQRLERTLEKLKTYALIHAEIESLKNSPHYIFWTLNLRNGICHAEAEQKWCEEAIKTLQQIRKHT